jgi:cytochrome c oxidase subunit I
MLHPPEHVERYRREAHARGRPSPYEVAAQAAGREEQQDDDRRPR